MEPITLFFANNLLSNKGHFLAKNKYLDRGSKQTIEDIIDSTDKTSDQNINLLQIIRKIKKFYLFLKNVISRKIL